MDPSEEIDWLIDDLVMMISGLMDLLEAGEITPARWQMEMEDLIGQYHFAAFMAGQQGEQLSPRSLDLLKDLINFQGDFLSRFRAEIESKGKFNRGWRTRAQMYAGAIRIPYWSGRTKMLPLPAMPAEGTQCLNNCNCEWRVEVIDEAAGDYDCYWELRPVKTQHCQTCIERHRQWYPIRVRGGDLVLGAQQGFTANEYKGLLVGLVKKHLAGSKFDHDQAAHGRRGAAAGGSPRSKSVGTYKQGDKEAKERLGTEYYKSLSGSLLEADKGEKGAVDNWIYSFVCSPIRKVQRGQELSENDKKIIDQADIEDLPAAVRTMESAFDKAPVMEGTTYRGMRDMKPETLQAWIEAGGIKLENDQSASEALQVARDFSGSSTPPGISVILKATGKSADITGYSIRRGRGSEAEHILRKGTVYRIKGVRFYPAYVDKKLLEKVDAGVYGFQDARKIMYRDRPFVQIDMDTYNFSKGLYGPDWEAQEIGFKLPGYYEFELEMVSYG